MPSRDATVALNLYRIAQEAINNAVKHARASRVEIRLATDGDRVTLTIEDHGPFEVASGCDVVRTARDEPDLAIFGGIDKRILAGGADAIDRELERIIPPLRARGGYIPTSDHGVPAEVSYANYLHYRKRCVELGG